MTYSSELNTTSLLRAIIRESTRVYLCPQLYKYDANQKLVPLQGEEIGQLIAHALSNKAAERRPWYEPSDKLPDAPIISAQALTEFDTVVVEMPPARNSTAKGS